MPDGPRLAMLIVEALVTLRRLHVGRREPLQHVELAGPQIGQLTVVSGIER